MKITDFGLAKRVEDRIAATYTMCGTPDYLAPEIILNHGHNKSADYWALGIIVFEMLTGLPPFYDANGGMTTLNRILKERPRYPEWLKQAAGGQDAIDFMACLLEHNVTKRLGCLLRGAEDVKEHAWFAELDWDAALACSLPVQFTPPSSDETDTSNFDDYPAYDGKMGKDLNAKDAALFEGW